MTTAENKTVGEIAAENPAAVPVFQKHGIDFCCGGKRPLGEVCREKGIPAAEVLEEIGKAREAAALGDTDWTTAPLSALAAHIVNRHHLYLEAELPRLDGMLAKVAEAHRDAHGDMLASLGGVYRNLEAELDSHMQKEEMVLFPLIGRMERAAEDGGPLPASHCGSVNNPIRVMEHEHDAAGEALAKLRELTGNYTLPGDACATFRALYAGLEALEADLHRHIHLENNILFPRAQALEARLTAR